MTWNHENQLASRWNIFYVIGEVGDIFRFQQRYKRQILELMCSVYILSTQSDTECAPQGPFWRSKWVDSWRRILLVKAWDWVCHIAHILLIQYRTECVPSGDLKIDSL